MKKILGISYILILLLTLTACISKAEREKGELYVRVGKKLIKEYVRETYGRKAKVSDFKPFYIREKYDSTVPNFNKIASGYVKATVSIKHNKFDILYNVHTKKVLTKENIGAVRDSFLSYANDVLQTGNLVDCKMKLRKLFMNENYISDFIEPDIMTYKELLSTGEYIIELTYSSINSDFDSIAEEKWEQLMSPFSDGDSESYIYMVFANYKDEEGYHAGADQDYFFYIDSETPYYKTEKAAEYTKDIIYMDSEERFYKN